MANQLKSAGQKTLPASERISGSNQDISRRQIAGWLFSHTKSLLPLLSCAVVLRIVGQLIGVAIFVVAAKTITLAVANQPITKLGIWLVVLSLAKAVLRYLEQYCGHFVAFTCLQRLRSFFFSRLVTQAPAVTQGKAGAELTDRATRDIDRIEVFYAHTIPPAISSILVPALALAWLGIWVSPTLAFTIAIFIVLALVIPFFGTRYSWKTSRELAGVRGELAQQLGDDIQGIKEVLSFDLESVAVNKLRRQDQKLSAKSAVITGLQAARNSLTTLVNSAALIAVIFVASWIEAGIETLLISLAVAISLLVPAKGIDDFATGLDGAFAAAKRVRDIAEAKPLVTEPQNPKAAQHTDQPLGAKLEAVTFGYPSENPQTQPKPVLRNVSIQFEPATWTFVLGVSGSGKSTIANLLVRGWDTDSGLVEVGDTPVVSYQLADLRKLVGIVSQTPKLLSGTILENLRLGNPQASETEIKQILIELGLDEFADNPERNLAERGLDISGGQMQRLSLARALLVKPKILILDESLSQLDGKTAAKIRSYLAGLLSEMTIIEITHRADLVTPGAKIVVIDQGKVVEQGEAEQLRVAGTKFSQLLGRTS